MDQQPVARFVTIKKTRNIWMPVKIPEEAHFQRRKLEKRDQPHISALFIFLKGMRLKT